MELYRNLLLLLLESGIVHIFINTTSEGAPGTVERGPPSAEEPAADDKTETVNKEKQPVGLLGPLRYLSAWVAEMLQKSEDKAAEEVESADRTETVEKPSNSAESSSSKERFVRNSGHEN